MVSFGEGMRQYLTNPEHYRLRVLNESSGKQKIVAEVKGLRNFIKKHILRFSSYQDSTIAAALGCKIEGKAKSFFSHLIHRSKRNVQNDDIQAAIKGHYTKAEVPSTASLLFKNSSEGKDVQPSSESEETKGTEINAAEDIKTHEKAEGITIGAPSTASQALHDSSLQETPPLSKKEENKMLSSEQVVRGDSKLSVTADQIIQFAQKEVTAFLKNTELQEKKQSFIEGFKEHFRQEFPEKGKYFSLYARQACEQYIKRSAEKAYRGGESKEDFIATLPTLLKKEFGEELIEKINIKEIVESQFNIPLVSQNVLSYTSSFLKKQYEQLEPINNKDRREKFAQEFTKYLMEKGAHLERDFPLVSTVILVFAAIEKFEEFKESGGLEEFKELPPEGIIIFLLKELESNEGKKAGALSKVKVTILWEASLKGCIDFFATQLPEKAALLDSIIVRQFPLKKIVEDIASSLRRKEKKISLKELQKAFQEKFSIDPTKLPGLKKVLLRINDAQVKEKIRLFIRTELIPFIEKEVFPSFEEGILKTFESSLLSKGKVSQKEVKKIAIQECMYLFARQVNKKHEETIKKAQKQLNPKTATADGLIYPDLFHVKVDGKAFYQEAFNDFMKELNKKRVGQVFGLADSEVEEMAKQALKQHIRERYKK